MTDARQIPSIAERYDLEWRRYPNRWLRWRWRAGWCVAALTSLVVLWPLAMGNHRVFLSRPVSDPHRWFEQDCLKCHDRHGQPLLRMLGFHSAHSVSNESCQACHTQRSDDHHPSMLQTPASSACVDCHQEHRGRSLRDVADAKCVSCHGQLARVCRDDRPRHVADSIPSWHDHPEFAVKRSQELFGEIDHILEQIARYDPANRRWSDPTELRFNHRVHLVPEGVPVPPGHPDFEKGQGLRRLQCQDCHQPQLDGRAMQPIRFEQHCQPCHRLEFHFSIAEGSPLPHGDTQLTVGVLRDRLIRYLEAHPEGLDRPQVDRGVLPTEPSGDSSAAPSPEQRAARAWQWVNQRWHELTGQIASPEVLYPIEPGSEHRQLKTGCRYCHKVEEPATGSDLSWRVVAPKIPARWLPMAEFSHRAHQIVACSECHFGVSRDQVAGHSEQTMDLLMPSIDVCRRCHASSGTRAIAGSAGTRCVDCHRYHARSYATVESLVGLTSRGASSPP